MLVSCKEETSFGPPQTADTSTLGLGGGGGAGGDTAAPNLCECATEAALGDPDCADCINSLKPNGKCVNPIAQCEASQDCLDTLRCPVLKCYSLSGEEREKCLDECFTAPVSDAAYQDMKDALACACNACSDECATKQVVTCP